MSILRSALRANIPATTLVIPTPEVLNRIPKRGKALLPRLDVNVRRVEVDNSGEHLSFGLGEPLGKIAKVSHTIVNAQHNARPGVHSFLRQIPAVSLYSSELRSTRRRHQSDVFRNRQMLVCAVKKLDGCKDELGVADIFEVVDLVLTRFVTFVLGLTGRVRLFERPTVMHMLAPSPSGHRRPKVIEHMAMKSDPLARRQMDHPDTNTLTFRNELRAYATIVLILLKFGRKFRRPRRTNRGHCRLFRHWQSHSVPPANPAYYQ